MLGFAALRAARHLHAVFSVWPAIHPGTWGDSTLDAELYKRADLVFAQSRFECGRLIELGVDPRRVIVSGCGPSTRLAGDAARFRSRTSVGDAPLILFIGRKQRYKGYHALCEAMVLLEQVEPRCRLVAVGADGDRPYPPYSARVIDLGRCSDQDKADALAACDVFCLPSIEESFGIVYIEAWAAGKPVVGGTAPAVRELVRDGEDGFCVEQDPRAIANALARLLSDRDLRMRLGEAGRRRQGQHFTWEAVAAAHRAAFGEALARRRASSTGRQ